MVYVQLNFITIYKRAREPIIGMWTLMWSKIMLNQKKDNLENRFLKPEYPFKHWTLAQKAHCASDRDESILGLSNDNTSHAVSLLVYLSTETTSCYFWLKQSRIFYFNAENLAIDGNLFMFDCSKNGISNSKLGIRDVSYKYPQVMHHLYGIHIF